jgi:BlaI family transcriptional regulator, penicillinase repressor
MSVQVLSSTESTAAFRVRSNSLVESHCSLEHSLETVAIAFAGSGARQHQLANLRMLRYRRIVHYTCSSNGCRMSLPKLSKIELQLMEALWTKGALSIREIQETFPEAKRPAYTTVQTMVYRLEVKKIVRRAKKISNAHIFEALISRKVAQRRLIDDFLGLFGGRTQPVMAHLIEAGKLTLEDVQEAEKVLRKLAKKGGSS